MLIRKICTGLQPSQLLHYSTRISQRLFSAFIAKESFINSRHVLRAHTNDSQQTNIAGFFIKNQGNRSIHFLSKNPSTSTYTNNVVEEDLLNVHTAFVQQNRGMAMRLELTEYGILWKRPEKVPSWKPEKSGDLKLFEEPDKTLPLLSLLNIASDVAKADEKVQRLLSLEFSSEIEVVKMAKYVMKRRIQSHKYDTNSREVQIALMTVDIRYLQRVVAANSRLIRVRVALQELIARRKKKLRILRKYDYRKFEWLLEELGIVYKPTPKNLIKISRKESLQQLVDLHCKSIREQKLERYRFELETMKRPFLEEKRQTFKWIAETEKRLGLPVSVVVPEEDGEIKQLGDGGPSGSETPIKEM